MNATGSDARAARVNETETLIALLERDALVRREAGRCRTTRRWQAAMMRAAARMLSSGDSGEDLRVPVACALIEVYGARCSDDEIAALVRIMVDVEIAQQGSR